MYLLPLLVGLALTLFTGLAMGDGFDGLYPCGCWGRGWRCCCSGSEMARAARGLSLVALGLGVAVFALWLPLANQPPPTEDAAAQAGFAAAVAGGLKVLVGGEPGGGRGGGDARWWRRSPSAAT